MTHRQQAESQLVFVTIDRSRRIDAFIDYFGERRCPVACDTGPESESEEELPYRRGTDGQYRRIHKDEIVLRADLPGMEQKDVKVTIQDGMLTVEGERKEEKEAKEDDYYHCERWAGAFTRSLALPAGIDADKIKATFKNGVLEVTSPRPPGPRARRSKSRRPEQRSLGSGGGGDVPRPPESVNAAQRV